MPPGRRSRTPSRIPQRAQEEILRRFIRNNSQTAFGREHGLAEIGTAEQFARRVPILDYDAIHPWIDRIRRGEQHVLTSEAVSRLVPTSGSRAARKLIPYTASMQRELNRAIGPWIFDLHRRHPRALLGPSYWSISPLALHKPDVAEDSAVPIGFDEDAAYLGSWRKIIVDSVMAVPSAVRSIVSIENWRYVTALLLLRRRSLRLISVWHPSFLELLLGAMRCHWGSLVRDIAEGTCAATRHLPPASFEWVIARPDPRRADELRKPGPAGSDGLWPLLEVLSCWADGHAAGAAAEMARALPSVPIQPKGLLATEGVISIPFAGQHPRAIRSHFLEFEDDSGNISMASDLQSGLAYEVILTNAGGLCRYRLNDRSKSMGWWAGLLRFASSADQVSCPTAWERRSPRALPLTCFVICFGTRFADRRSPCWRRTSTEKVVAIHSISMRKDRMNSSRRSTLFFLQTRNMHIAAI